MCHVTNREWLGMACALLCVASADAAIPFRAAGGAIEVVGGAGNTWQLISSGEGEFALESSAALPAGAGACFRIAVRIQADLRTRAVPELVCFDGAGREIPGRSLLLSTPTTVTTAWQEFDRVFPVRPGAKTVRARIHGMGHGTLRLSDFTFAPAQVDPYETGALVTQTSPQLRAGLILESNLGIENEALVSHEDRDGDLKWALIQVNIDELSTRRSKGEDWRTSFAYNPNLFYWSDGAVLKSDSVREDRTPDVSHALHFRMPVHAGPYRAILSDPGRSVAVSLDGQNWQRFEGGSEAELGVIAASDGVVEFWVDACYRDPVTVGPAYFDYVRVFPVDHAPSARRLFEAARQRPGAVARGSVERREVPVTFEAPRFARGAHWPVRCGLPIPEGELASATQATVLDEGGHAIETQNRALGTWPDGSVKWLYLDFAHDLSRGGTGRYTVVYGTQAKARSASAGVKTREVADGIDVDTGAIRFTIAKSHFGVIENVQLASGEVVQRDPVAIEITEKDGTVWKALDQPAERLDIEQAGPLHTIIRASTRKAAPGVPSKGFYHNVRVHAYADSPLVQLDYFVANTDERSELRARSIRLAMRPARSGDGGGSTVQADASDAARSWATIGGAACLSVGIEAMREQYPKAIRWTPEELQVDLWAPEGGDYLWYQGVGKTHRVSLLYDRDVPEEAAALSHGPVLALAAPAWYARSGVFGPIGLAAESPLPEVEKTLASHMAGPIISGVGLGFEDFGDHHSKGYVKGSFLWDNNEYDVPAACMIHFVRTGDVAALRLGLASALHYVDVDMIHYSRQHPEWVGTAHTHSHGSFGHHTAEAPTMSHAGYVQGLIWYTCLTGDPAGIEGARGIAEWVLKGIAPEVNTGRMERTTGHPLMTLNDVYEATWDDRYLEGAARLVDWTMKWEAPQRGGFPAIVTERPACYGGSPYCSGVLFSAMMKFNAWAKDRELDGVLERTGRYLLTDMWRPPANIVAKAGSGTSADAIACQLRLMSSLYEKTHDPLFLALPLASVNESYGKGVSIDTRSTGLVFNYLPWFLRELAAQGGPTVESQLKMSVSAPDIPTAPGAIATARVTIRNEGTTPIAQLAVSFQPRLDFKVVRQSAVPSELGPGQEVSCTVEVQAPARINLTSQDTINAHAQWSAIYRREGRSHLAHAWTRLVIDGSRGRGRTTTRAVLPSVSEGVKIERDIPYLAAGREERLDLYMPTDEGSNDLRPAVVIIHGGGWTAGDKAAAREFNIGTTLAKAGYVCASINYRLAQPGRWPTNLQDCKNAVRFLRSRAARYHVDADNIGVIGGSAGGHLALMVAYTPDLTELEPSELYPGVSSRVRAVVNMYGITDLLTRRRTDDQGNPVGPTAMSSALIEDSPGLKADALRLGSPVTHVSPQSPPTLILHGTKDTTVDRDQASELARRLAENHVEHELIWLEGVGHTFDLQTWAHKPLPRDLRPVVIGFFDRHLKRQTLTTTHSTE